MKSMWKWTKKTLVISSPPFLMGLIVFGLFRFIPQSYLAEAEIRIEGNPTIFPVQTETALGTDSNHSRPYTYWDHLEATIQSPPVLRQLGYRMALADWEDHSDLPDQHDLGDQLNLGILPFLKGEMKSRLRNLQPFGTDAHLDSLLHLLLAHLSWEESSLRKLILIRPHPEKQTLAITTQAAEQQHALRLANFLCAEFIRYFDRVEQERLESTIIDLQKLVAQRKEAWDQRRAELDDFRRNLHEGPATTFSQSLLNDIQSLEKNRLETVQKVMDLRQQIQEQGPIIPAVKTREGLSQSEPHPSDLQHALDMATARLKFLDRKLQDLHSQLDQLKDTAVAPYLHHIEEASLAYENAQSNLELALQKDKGEGKLVQQAPAYATSSHPYAIWLVSGLTFIATLCIWIVILFQIGYLEDDRNKRESQTAIPVG